MKKTYYLFNPGHLQRKDNTLKFTPIEEDENGVAQKEGAPRYIPVEGVGDLFVFGSLTANSALYNFLGQNNIAVHFFDYYENYTGSFMPRDSLLSGKMLLAQTAHYQNKNKRIVIARKFVEGAAWNMLKNLQYYNRRGKDAEPLITLINKYMESIPQSLRALRDCERRMNLLEALFVNKNFNMSSIFWLNEAIRLKYVATLKNLIFT